MSTIESPASTSQWYVLMSVENQVFAIPTSYTIELPKVDWSEISELPNSDPSIIGMLNHRGFVIPVIEARALLGIQSNREHDPSLIVLQVEGNRIGLIVDRIESVLELSEETIADIPGLAKSASGLVGTVARMGSGELVGVLDMNAVSRQLPDREREAA